MKKLMIAAAIAMTAVCSQAVTYKWAASNGIGGAAGDYTTFTTATTAYLIDVATLSQSDLYDAVKGGQTLAQAVNGKTLNEASLSGGKMTAKTAQPFPEGYNANDPVSAYMVLFDSDLNAIYFSEQLNKTVNSAQDTKFTFEALSSFSKDIAADMTGFKTASGGWVQAVPEPTSGLLLLLGVAGLALRRRRA